MSNAVIDVVLSDVSYSCDLCCGERGGDHWVWECPACGEETDHYQENTPVEYVCRCGARVRVSTAEHERWARYETRPV